MIHFISFLITYIIREDPRYPFRGAIHRSIAISLGTIVSELNEFKGSEARDLSYLGSPAGGLGSVV